MMAKKALGVAALALTMVPANATIARLQALGMTETDNEGSYFIEDDRNIFLNVANINNYKDTVILEWGDKGNNFGGAQLQTDETYNTKAKGGFLKASGDYVYGVYVGNESNTSALLRGVATGAYAASSAVSSQMLNGSDNQLDVFFGGESSAFKWAVNGVYTADYNQSINSRDYGYAVRGGLIGDKWDVLLNLSVGSKSHRKSTVASGTAAGQTHSYTFDGKLGFQIGGGYKINDHGKVYGFVKKFDWEQFDSIGTTAGLTPGLTTGTSPNGRGQLGTVDGGFITYALGYGTTHTMGKGTLFTNVEYRHTSIELEFTNKAEAKNVIVPIKVAYEYDATSWLTLRGSVSHNVYGIKENNNYGSLSFIGENAATAQFGATTNGGKVTLDNTTDVRAGATLKFGKLKVDGLIGLGSTNGQVGITGTSGTAIQERGVFDMDRLLARVGMVYSF